jgi:hypothetical protein
MPPPARLRRAAAGLAFAGALAGAVACGERPGEAPAPPADPSTVSAFRFAAPGSGVRHDVPLEQIRQGIPGPAPRDVIPALREPRFVPAGEARHVADEARVILLEVGPQARIYPLRILDAHELVNDVVGGEAVLVTWCPLCRSAMVFERRVAGEVRTFGVSGYLYRSAVLMYDHQTETFWSQIAARAVVGPLTGARLAQRAAAVTSFADARGERPDALVLASEQESRRPADYERDPYAAYHARPDLMFPVDAYDRRLPRKAEVVGVVVGEAALAVELAWLAAQPGGRAALAVGGRDLLWEHDAAADRVRVTDVEGRAMPHLRCSWFAWFAFHQKTALRSAG